MKGAKLAFFAYFVLFRLRALYNNMKETNVEWYELIKETVNDY